MKSKKEKNKKREKNQQKKLRKSKEEKCFFCKSNDVSASGCEFLTKMMMSLGMPFFQVKKV